MQMLRDVIMDGVAMRSVEGLSADDKLFADSFEEFRITLETARLIGSINSMREAVEAYDRFEAVARSV